tara:strand:- start:1697 stop:2014 length:318 start_codon:yes stop_codon:yes gene_type:complete
MTLVDLGKKGSHAEPMREPRPARMRAIAAQEVVLERAWRVWSMPVPAPLEITTLPSWTDTLAGDVAPDMPSTVAADTSPLSKEISILGRFAHPGNRASASEKFFK